MTTSRFKKRYLLAIICVIIIILAAGCSFDESGVSPIPDIFDNVSEITKSYGNVVFSAPGQVFTYHGCDCASSKLPDGVYVQQKLTLPSNNFIDAAVYLNGWKFKFQDSEKQVAGFVAAIGDPTNTPAS